MNQMFDGIIKNSKLDHFLKVRSLNRNDEIPMKRILSYSSFRDKAKSTRYVPSQLNSRGNTSWKINNEQYLYFPELEFLHWEFASENKNNTRYPNIVNSLKKKECMNSFSIKPLEEGLKKGQNQLILERLQEKYLMKGMSKTKSYFHKKKRIQNAHTSKESRPSIKNENKTTNPQHDKSTVHSDISPTDNKAVVSQIPASLEPNQNNEHKTKAKEDNADDIEVLAQECDNKYATMENFHLGFKKESKGEQESNNVKSEKYDENKKDYIINTTSTFKDKSKSNTENSSNTFQKEFNVKSVINRVLENNRKEAASKSKDFLADFGKDYMNKTGRKFFFAPSSGSKARPCSEKKEGLSLHSIEFILERLVLWRKHEEIWTSITSLKESCSDLEKYLIPPNDQDVLLSSYIKLLPSLGSSTENTITICTSTGVSNPDGDNMRITLNEKIRYPKLEMKRWKEAYKKALLRWHPDKLFPLLVDLKIKDETKRVLLRKKSTIIINSMVKMYQSVIEILRKLEKNT